MKRAGCRAGVGWWLPFLAALTLGPATDVVAQSAGGTQGVVERTPVVLVPGWSEEGQDLEPQKKLFVDAGWPPASVLVLGFEDPEGSNRDHARELSVAVDSLLALTGADRVDVVAHSMGGLATRYYLQEGGAEKIRRVAFLATPHRGTWVAYLAWGEGGREMHPGSLFLLDLQRFRGVPEGVEAITVRTKVDLHVIPPESATMTGIPDVEVCCPSHLGLLTHPDAFEAVERFLTRTP